jgi:hypothetical protein
MNMNWSAYVDISDFTLEERKRWLYEIWNAADGTGMGIGVLYSLSNRDVAVREIEQFFTKDYLNVREIAGKSIKLSFAKTGKAVILCSLYDKDNSPGLASRVTHKFRKVIGKPEKELVQ